ncbi:MAG: (d)CMP kinase [Lachnospiraceae bacterium]|nr:(d)CMP kinase [Lachnospiraceae bacterium]
MNKISIAIDGPAGVGKSTIAKMLAEELKYVYVDTGALYRAIAVFLSDCGISPDDLQEKRIADLIRDIRVEIRYEDGTQHVLVNGTDVTGRLRTQEISRMASVTSAIPCVREKLLDLQRELAEKYDVIMDGRDIGTVVLPQATLKLFLTASAYVRAKRRYDQLKESGILGDETLSSIQKEIEERDYQDSHREIAPLKPADDAVIVDSSDLSMEEEIRMILSHLKEKIR